MTSGASGRLSALARDLLPAYLLRVSRIAFLPVVSPKLRTVPPTGSEWLHEVKFDGFRIQLQKSGNEVRLFSRNGKDFTDKFPSIRDAVATLPAGGAIIDGEIVAFDEAGKPDFHTLIRRRAFGVSVWCFDLLGLGGDDLRPLPVEKRKERLSALLSKFDGDQLKMSESFDDGSKLLEAAAHMNLEGIVSKKRSAPYIAGVGCGWIKVKTQAWREANRERYKLFEKA